MTASIDGESRMLIDGKLVHSATAGTRDDINPATEEVIGACTDASAADMDRAIAAARRAFDETTWSRDHAFRRRCIEQLQDALEGEADALRAELVAEAGTPVALTAIAQLDWPLTDSLLWPARLIDDFAWERELPDSDLFGVHSLRRVWKEAVGVVGAIAPWNFPFEIALNKLGPALAAGNTVVLKPAPDTPFNATRIGRLVAEQTDIPAGVVNVVPTTDNAVAELLVTDPRVDMISFTGSTATGRRILEKSAPTVKRTFLELGGKSAVIVLDDADFPTVLPQSANACIHAGQGCSLGTRLVVPRSRYAEAVAIVTAVFEQVPYGDPTDPSTLSGPLINARQRERVLGYIERGKAEGARITVGGGIPAHLDRGFYVMPTVFADADNGMAIAREEIFGPVLTVIPYDDAKGDEDALRIANDNPYGLAGYVLSGSTQRALEISRRIRAGSVNVNGALYYGADAPFGGYKASGLGRQGGLEGFEQYLQTKSVAYDGAPS